MRIPTDDRDGEESLVNLTPLIDVVFLLLIFFMVTATFQNDERDLTIAVPETQSGDPIKDLPETMVVGVRKDGAFRIGDRQLDLEQLRKVLVRAKRKNAKQNVIVRADKAVPFRFPVTVLDVCTGLGITTSVATAEVGGN